MLDLNLQSLSVHHAPVLSALHQDGFDEAWSETAMATLLSSPGSGGLIATSDVEEVDQPLGFLLWRIAADEAELITITTRREYRDKGVATALINEGCQVLCNRKVQRFFLDVAVDNDAALALYKRHHFQEVGRRKGYYKRNDGRIDALVLAKQLSGI